MREHIHAPAHDEFMIQPAWNEPSRDAEGNGVVDVIAFDRGPVTSAMTDNEALGA